jgi:hypothetical protein
MNLSIPSTARFLTRTKHGAESTPKGGHPKPERVDGIHLQEQFTGIALSDPLKGPARVRTERPAAEVLAERLAESGSIFPAAPMFVP